MNTRSEHRAAQNGERGRGQAQGKVILLGEHAVVYGSPALAAGIDRGARAHARRADRTRVTVNGQSFPEESELHSAATRLQHLFSVGPVELDLTLDLPAGSGLGASAALGVASVRALASLEGATAVDEGEASARWEEVFHGNPSGIDAEAARGGGVFRFLRGIGKTEVPVPAPLPLVVAVAGPPASTRAMVEQVARLRSARPDAFERTLTAIAGLVESAEGCLLRGDLPTLGKLFDLNQMLLSGWLVSTPAIERACALAREAGALGAKLTGSGGGGCIIALCPEPAPVEERLRASGLHCFFCHSGGVVPNAHD